MDKEIPKETILRRRKVAILKATGVVLAICLVLWLIAAQFGKSVKAADLRLGTADAGTIETTISASGRVAPLFEEIINSPIASRILEVYCTAGDSVTAGMPLLRLDLESTEIEMRRLDNERAIQQAGKEKLGVAARTAFTNLQMQVQVKEMAVEKLKEDMANERRLDSIGSGTGERVRQAELAYNTACLELEQMRKQLANERLVQDAEMRVQDLNISISAGNITQMRRTLEDARLKAPRAATLTYIVNEVGRQVAQGEKLAVVADLKHFKVEGEIADAHAQKFGTGSRAMVKIGAEALPGTITNVVPQSSGGVIAFTVSLDDNANPRLRSGQTTQVYILTDIIEDAVRIPAGSYYSGPGNYKLFVKTGDSKLERREVRLGDANYEYVEVISGLQPGEVVALNDMKEYANNKSLKINK